VCRYPSFEYKESVLRRNSEISLLINVSDCGSYHVVENAPKDAFINICLISRNPDSQMSVSKYFILCENDINEESHDMHSEYECFRVYSKPTNEINSILRMNAANEQNKSICRIMQIKHVLTKIKGFHPLCTFVADH
jgi:hypothetical protein